MMNARLFVVILLLFILSSVASAQTYHVRVTYNTNLRTSYSLESAVIANARAGTTVLVVGSFGRWFKINRDGNEVWMANWVPYTRVEGQQTPSDIDNCCFVDRQCQSDTDWTNGYWAYQRNECSVSTAITQPTTAQPTSSTPAQVDNCCFVDWQCNTDDEWVSGYWAYQNNQCGAASSSTSSRSHGNLIIEGGETFHIWVEAGLDLLKRKAPQWYNFVLGGTRKIKQLPAGAGARMAANRTHITAWGNDDYPNALNIYTIAHEMIHEACHGYQSIRGYHPERWRDELECVEKELAASFVIDPHDTYDRHSFWRETIANIRDPSTWWWD